MEGNRKNWSGSYEDVIKWFKLQPEAGFQVLDVTGESPLVEMIVERSLMLRNSVMLWLCQEGSLMVAVEGTSHTLKAGQMLVIFAGTYCRFQTISSDLYRVF